jgi:hypothetical protein
MENNILNIYDLYGTRKLRTNKIEIVKYDDNIYNFRYENKTFIIDPNISFKDCKIYKSKNKYSINININLQNNEHDKILNVIDMFNDKIKEFNFNIQSLNISNIQSLFNSKKSSDIKILYGTINKNTIIINIDQDQNINLDMLFDKKFIMYPIFWSPNINLYNNNIYVNFVLYKIYVKIIEIENKNVQYTPNIENIKNSINKLI